MANYANLKATINANIKANGTEAITGPVLNSVLTAAVNTLGAGYQFMGVATTSTNPGTPDANVFYIAATPGTYTNFGGKTVADGEVAILKYNGSWTKEVTGAATAAQLTQLGQKVDGINIAITQNDVSSTNGSRWVDNNGKVASDSSGVLKRVEMISIVPGALISLETTLSYATNPAGFICDDEDNILVTIDRVAATTSYSGTIPAGGTRLYVNYVTTLSISIKTAGKQDELTFDDIPTANSQNPVKSGGVYSKIEETKSEFSQFSQELSQFSQELNGDTPSATFISGNSKWIDDNGVIGIGESSSLKRIERILVAPGVPVSYVVNSLVGPLGANAVIVTDAEGNVLYKSSTDAIGTITTPVGSVYMYFNSAGTTFECTIFGLTKSVEDLQMKVPPLEQKVNDTTLTSSYGITINSKWIDNNGVIGTASSTSYGRVNAINVYPGQKITYTTDRITGLPLDALIITDASDNVLKVVPFTTTPQTESLVVPANAAKLYFNFNNATTFSCTLSGVDSQVKELSIPKPEKDIVAEVEPYLAKARGTQQSIALDSSMFISNKNIDGTTGQLVVSDNTIATEKYFRVFGRAVITYHTDNSYRLSVASYGLDGFLKKNEWFAGDGNLSLSSYAAYIRLVIAVPSGQSGTPSFDDAGLALSMNPGVKLVEAAPLESKIELPIYAPSPQLPANASSDSDFNAETLTPGELFGAVSDYLDSLPKPGLASDLPKYGGTCSKVGRDASNTFDIYAYHFGLVNRFAWKAADALFAWKNGSTIVYTDSISPRVGDTIYSSATRTDSGNTVSSFNSANQSITSSASVTYARSNSDNVATDVLWSKDAQSTSSPTNKTLYDKAGTSKGTATATDATHLTLSGKSYARCADLDYHTKQKMTIVFWGNEHGPQSDPAEPAIILYRLMKDLCSSCRNNAFLAFLKNYCKVVIIPCANPYGLQNHTRNNANNVNINRNYCTPGWGQQSDSDKGSYAGDQPETQFIMNTAVYYGADLCIDIHCLGYTAASNEGRTHYQGFIPDATINDRVQENMLGYGVSYTNYGNAQPNSSAQGSDWIYYNGIAGGLIEMNAGYYASSGGDGRQHTAFVMEVDYTLLLETLRMWMYGVDNTLDLSVLSIR